MHKESILIKGVEIIRFAALGILLCLFTLLYKVNSNYEFELHEQGFACGVIDPYNFDSLANEGKILFRNNCATCHNKNMTTDLTGPALADSEMNWMDYPRTDLYQWIRSSQSMIEAGHPKALELWNAWKPAQMNAFPNLSDEEIEAILAYIEVVYASSY